MNWLYLGLGLDCHIKVDCVQFLNWSLIGIGLTIVDVEKMDGLVLVGVVDAIKMDERCFIEYWVCWSLKKWMGCCVLSFAFVVFELNFQVLWFVKIGENGCNWIFRFVFD